MTQKIETYVTGFNGLPRLAFNFLTIGDCLVYRLFKVVVVDDEIIDCFGAYKW